MSEMRCRDHPCCRRRLEVDAASAEEVDDEVQMVQIQQDSGSGLKKQSEPEEIA